MSSSARTQALHDLAEAARLARVHAYDSDTAANTAIAWDNLVEVAHSLNEITYAMQSRLVSVANRNTERQSLYDDDTAHAAGAAHAKLTRLRETARALRKTLISSCEALYDLAGADRGNRRDRTSALRF